MDVFEGHNSNEAFEKIKRKEKKDKMSGVGNEQVPVIAKSSVQTYFPSFCYNYYSTHNQSLSPSLSTLFFICFFLLLFIFLFIKDALKLNYEYKNWGDGIPQTKVISL